MDPLELNISPFRTTTGLNSREHWRARARRVQMERIRTASCLEKAARGCMPGDPSGFRKRCGSPPFVVTLTRVCPRATDDDNVIAGFKAVRDETAHWLGTGDSPSAPVQWRYGQERGPFAVRIRIESQQQ